METKKARIEWLAITFGFLFGVIFGMLIMHFIYVDSAEKIFQSVEGIISNINININETKLIEIFNDTIIPQILNLEKEKNGN